LSWDIGEVNREDDMVYHCTMTFDGDSPLETLRKIKGLSEQNSRNISLNIVDLYRLGKA
jgi:hypothetical protein